MPVYARYRVRYAWIVDPRERTLEADKRCDETRKRLAAYGAEDNVGLAPFGVAVFPVGALWG